MMEIKIFSFTGYEDECEICFYNYEGKYVKTYYLENMQLKLSMDREGIPSVHILKADCIIYDDNDNSTKHTLTPDEISAIEQDMCEYIDWCKWLEDQKPEYDDY